eukprot:TRINITY_DN55874_c0_g1_i1.p1 TRINITY_DN55874_c0_g1~~TRINITY_DN55874_c0_g1_i1.p1  ORF type:complete len:291 (-),score=52.99 TRINITY_DN55874_c0_g1_i1:432-1244(-)
MAGDATYARTNDKEATINSYNEAAEGTLVQIFDAQPVIQEASLLKEKGNTSVKQKNFNEAVKIYEQGIAELTRCDGYPMIRDEEKQVQALKALLHSNIAQCMLNLQLYQRAVQACTDCLGLDEANVKALHRRSLAHEALKEYEDALRDALALRKLGKIGLDSNTIEKRCEELYKKLEVENKTVNQVYDANKELFQLKEKFDAVFEKYDLGDGTAAPLVAQWLVSDNDLSKTVERVAKRWQMDKSEAEHIARWISKGLELKIIPTPQQIVP